MAERPSYVDPDYWLPGGNSVVWEEYLKGIPEGGHRAVPYTAALGRAGDLRGLPPTHLGVGALDPFHDETVRFAERLKSDDVGVESYV